LDDPTQFGDTPQEAFLLGSLFFLFVGMSPQDGQDGMSQQCERDVPRPSTKTSHLILIEPNFSFGLFKAFFDPPAAPSHTHQFSQGDLRRSVGSVVRPLARFRETPSDQNPMELPLACRLLLWKLEPSPLVKALPQGSIPALNVSCFSCFLTNRSLLLFWNHSLIGTPKISVTVTNTVYLRNSFP
jgi:hypothetical protein